MPVVTATTAWLGLRPVAKAFGDSFCTTKTLGMGISLRRATSATMRCSSGSSSRVTSLAPAMLRASLSEKKYATKFMMPAKINAMRATPGPPST